ncbi:unnamed protein product [Heterobilharzia americana]|nr:unnamed protein product [Heterobilharzia americana]
MLNSDCLIDSDYDSDLALNTIVAFTSRHLTEEIEGQVLYQEKYQKEKIKTLTVALIICLNIDIDPPDVQKISPFSRVEAWFDPTDANSLHALETIGKNLQSQYERWQPRARYKQCLDPTLDDVKKLCLSLRRNAKDDRILFHYNGHGVPRPTENGEIWVFNTKFTKYIPLSLYDLQRWLGAPSVYVLDCQNAGRIIQMYEVFCERRKAEAAVAEQKLMEYDGKTDHSEAYQSNHPIRSGLYEVSNLPDSHVQGSLQSTPHVVSMENTIMLAACGKDEDLPQNPNLPADLFTACLTTPIRMALRWHWLRHQEYFPGYLDEALLDRIPGSHSNRMSLLGEINWIFTAVTDTIAWCSFPLDIFQKLFRQDLLIASLFRNFLLAERIMKSYGCQPVSAPLLLPTYQHSMWDAWDHTLDRVIHYLPRMLKIMEGSPYTEKKLPIINANPTTSGQLSHLLHHNYHQGNTVNHHSSSKAINTVNNHNNYNTSHRITGPVGNIPIDFCTNRTGHLCTQQQPQPPQGILTGGGGGGAATGCSGQLQRQTTTIPAFCLLPTRPHNSSNILPSNQILNDSTNFTVINPVVSVSTTTITSTLPSVSTGVSTTTVSKVSIPAPLVNHQNNQLNRQLNVENHLGSTNLHDVNDRSTVYQYNGGGGGGGGGGLPSNCRRSQFQTVSSQVSTLVPQSKTFKPIQSSVAPPPGFNLEQTKQQRRLEAEITNTVTKRPVPALIESEQHDICAVDKDDNNAGVNRDIIKTKSDSHDVDQKQQLQLPKLPKGNKSDHQSPEDHKITSHSRNANSTAGQNASPEPPTTSVLASNDENKKSTSNNTSSFGVDTSSVLTLINCHQQQLGEASTNDSTHSTEKDDAKSSEIVTNNQNVNQNKPKNMVTASPMKPQKQTVTNYPHGYEKLYLLPNGGDISGLMGPCRHRVNTKSIVNQLPPSLIPTIKTTALQPNTVRQHLDPRTCVRLPTEPGNRLQNHNPLQSENSPYINRSLINSNANMIPPNQQILLNSLPPSDSGQPAQMISTTVSSGSVIGGSGPASFFTSQMTAFKIWLQTADERRPPATQLPILLQILLSQSHRIRAMQLLSEFLDLGPWAVTHCLTVGIFPYIVRLFHSPVPEVKPYLVFIWGKIIASAQTEFGRNDSVRDFGYKYFITCLGDTENLSPLTRTITAFALAKMLEKDQSGEPDPFFQDVYLKQNFLPIVLTQLFDNTPIHDQEMHIRMRLWLILALAKLWCKNDEARWFGIRHNLPEVLLAYLNDISPEVRAATVYALGNLIENQTTDASKQDHADQISHEIGGQLVKISSRDASPLVRCMLVEAFRGLVKQFESQLCAIGIQYIQEIKVRQSQQPIGPKLSVLSASPCPIKRPMRHSTISLITPTSGSTGGLNVSRQLESNSSSYIYSNSNGLPLTRPTGREDHQLVVKSQSYYRTHVNLQQQQQQQASPILRKSFNNSASVFFTGSGNTPSTNIYVQFWLTLVQLAQDPYPEISRLATIIIQYLYAKIREKAEYQTICNPPNVVGGDSSSTLDTASTIVPLPDVYASNYI